MIHTPPCRIVQHPEPEAGGCVDLVVGNEVLATIHPEPVLSPIQKATELARRYNAHDDLLRVCRKAKIAIRQLDAYARRELIEELENAIAKAE